MILSRKVPRTSNSSHLFWNLKDLVLTLSYRRKTTYALLLFPDLNVQDVRAEQATTNEKAEELNRQFPFGNDLSNLL